MGWVETKELWALEHGDTAEPIDVAGGTYRGEPPDWWFHSDGSDIFRVHEGFLSEDEVAAALERLRSEANIRGQAHSGFDMVCQVSRSPSPAYQGKSQLITCQLRHIANPIWCAR